MNKTTEIVIERGNCKVRYAGDDRTDGVIIVESIRGAAPGSVQFARWDLEDLTIILGQLASAKDAGR